MMKTLKSNRIFIAGAVCFVLLFLILNIYTPLIADDFSHSLGIHSVKDILISQYSHHFNWGGRNVAHFFAQFWLLVGKSFFNIANTIVYCAFIFLVQFHITGKHAKSNPALFLALNIFFWFFTPVWGQNFLWLTGSCNYLWTTTIILFFLVPFRKKQDDPDYRWNIPSSVLFFLAGILAGWSNENSGAAVLFLLIAYFINKIIKKNKLTSFEIFGTIGFLIGFFLLITAPGNYVRAEVIQQMGNYNEMLVIKFAKRFFNITLMFTEHGFLFLAISVLFGLELIYHQKRKLTMFSYFYFLATLAGIYSMLLSPNFPDRAFLIVIVFLAITLGNILAQMELPMYGIIKRNISFVVFVALIGLSFSFLNTGKKILGVYLRWYDRVEYIFAEKEKGNLEIEVKQIEITDKHAALYGLLDILPDGNEWPNTSIADYFGLNSIIGNDEPMETLWQEKGKRIRQIIIPPPKYKY